MDPFVGEIRLFPYNFVPKGWLSCDGRQIPIQQNAVLFSLLGVQFGGNGTTTFALPDLRGRTALGHFSGGTTDAGLSVHNQGESSGAEQVMLPADALAQHSHEVYVSTALGSGGPSGAFPATSANMANPPVASRSTYVKAATTGQVALNPATLQSTPAQQPLDNMQPSLCLQYCIAASGVYPPRP
ncbi:Phage Tail Collar Domain protein [compost metagenome]